MGSSLPRMAKRAAQAHSLLPPDGAPSALERAEYALADRVKAFTEASEALRAEIRAFDAVIAEIEGRPAAPELKLVVSRETAEMEAIDAQPKEAVEGDDYRPTHAQIAEFFRAHEQREDANLEPERIEPLGPDEAHPRKLNRERLYADIGGTIIGLSGAAALISLMLK
jgi:hypothetical protein